MFPYFTFQSIFKFINPYSIYLQPHKPKYKNITKPRSIDIEKFVISDLFKSNILNGMCIQRISDLRFILLHSLNDII